jgi:AcrR family transcriptional regulator
MGLNERKNREKEKRRNEILKAAKKAFIIYGLHSTTMDKIAAQAELAKGTLYLYYSSKEELILSLVAGDLEQLIEKIESVIAEAASPAQKLMSAVAEFYGFSKRNQFMYSAMTQLNIHEMSTRKSKSDVSSRMVCANNKLMDLMMGVINEGVERGEFFISESPKQVVAQIILALKGSLVMIRNGMIPKDWNGVGAEDVLTNIATLMVRGLSNPLLNVGVKKNKK